MEIDAKTYVEALRAGTAARRELNARNLNQIRLYVGLEGPYTVHGGSYREITSLP
jgi:hypothetical protein